MTARGIHRKATFEDRFSRNYACWVKNNTKAWKWWKRNNRKALRRFLKELLEDELDEIEREETD